MERSTSLTEWLPVLRGEYLQDFIKSGGASVKVLITEDEDAATQTAGLVEMESSQQGYFAVRLDAAHTKLHLIEQIFFAVAREVDWDQRARMFLEGSLTAQGYTLPPKDRGLSLEALASANELELPEMRRKVNAVLGAQLRRDFRLTQEFRTAMLRLCEAQLEPEGNSNVALSVKDWLRGEIKLLSSLKAALIFQKIGRHNARFMLYSLAYWLRRTGASGFVLVLDISRYMTRRRTKDPEDDTLYYSGPALLDGYEVLRQFVDSTDELQYGLIVAIAPKAAVPPFDEGTRRGFQLYDALWLRIADDVWDKNRFNPLATLVRLSK